jgi:hypothetical protein
MPWYRWTGLEGYSVGNRGKLVKALQTPAMRLARRKSLFTLAEQSALGMRKDVVPGMKSDRIRELPG